jgi:hypothetical protein
MATGSPANAIRFRGGGEKSVPVVETYLRTCNPSGFMLGCDAMGTKNCVVLQYKLRLNFRL